MDLPILNVREPVDNAELVRRFHKLRFEAAAAVAEPVTMDVGVVVCDPSLPTVPEANCVFDAAVPVGMSTDAARAAVDEWFHSFGALCLRWVLNPSQETQRIASLETALCDRDYVLVEEMFGVVRGQIAASLIGDESITILPARSAYSATERLAREIAGDEPSATAWLRRLDDPRYDVLIALQAGQPVARCGLLSLGDMGLLDSIDGTNQTSPQTVTELLRRALDTAARGQLRYVLTADPSRNSSWPKSLITLAVGRYRYFERPRP